MQFQARRGIRSSLLGLWLGYTSCSHAQRRKYLLIYEPPGMRPTTRPPMRASRDVGLATFVCSELRSPHISNDRNLNKLQDDRPSTNNCPTIAAIMYRGTFAPSLTCSCLSGDSTHQHLLTCAFHSRPISPLASIHGGVRTALDISDHSAICCTTKPTGVHVRAPTSTT